MRALQGVKKVAYMPLSEPTRGTFEQSAPQLAIPLVSVALVPARNMMPRRASHLLRWSGDRNWRHQGPLPDYFGAFRPAARGSLQLEGAHDPTMPRLRRQ